MKLSDKSDQELTDLQTAILKEQALRRKLDASPEKIEHAIAEYQETTGKGAGEGWEQPTGPLNAYRQGAVVEHEGQIWVSTHGNNVHSPGQSGWRLKPELDEDGNEIPPPYVQPSGAHDAYQRGEMVTYEGEVYRAVRDGVVHSPSEYPADWSHVIPATPIEPIEPDPDEGEEPGEPETPEWDGNGHSYETGDQVLYEGDAYKVIQDHTSAAHWTPDTVASLYEKVDES